MTRQTILRLTTFVLVLFLSWSAYDRWLNPYAVERENRIAVAKVLTETFEGTSELKVSTLSGTVQATAADARMGGLLLSDQVMQAPYSVEYTVDVGTLTLADYMWDGATQTLTVRAPDIVVGEPNIDEAKMTVQRRGIFITRDAFDAMSRTASRRAGTIAGERAKSPELIAKAREKARTAIVDLLRGPLVVAGKGNINIVVRFPADGIKSNERWDESRTLADVLGS
jgi:Protein of unknown function (DUF4230)